MPWNKQPRLYNYAVQQIKKTLLEPTEDCLLWEYGLKSTGYGTVTLNYEDISLHRLSLEMKIGRPITEGYESAHSCRNRNCYSPWHLSEKTLKEHAQDKYRDRTSKRHEGPRSDNTSGFKGVSWHKRDEQWSAKINIDEIDTWIGYFDTAEDAARAYDNAAGAAWENDCYLNFR